MFFLRIYKNIFSYLVANKKLVFITLLFIAESIVYCLINSEADISSYLAYHDENRPQYGTLFSFILFENTQAMLPAIIMGTVPFFLGTLFCTYSTVHSLVIALKYIISSLPIETILAGTLPHGIFEIPAIIFSMIFSAIISKEITLAILSFVTKKKFDNPKSILYRNGLKETAVFAVETIFLILIPLVFLGALTEAFVTGRILENFI